MPLQIIETSDGSKTLYSTELKENYHSIYGAMTESQYVYIQNALYRRLSLPHHDQLSLLEVGFGTGLNCLLTLLSFQQSQHPLQLLYQSYDIAPLPLKLIHELYHSTLSEESWRLMEAIHQAPWDQATEILPRFILCKYQKDLTSTELQGGADVIYMDAFAPEVTPHLWADPFLRKLAQSARKDCVLSTYCAKGAIRRKLQELGFQVDRVPGPPQGKREILSCIKQATNKE